MGLLKKLWNIQPAVIIAKEVNKSGVLKPKPKKQKLLSVSGEYFSSHPAIHGEARLTLEFGPDGVSVYGRKRNTPTIKQFTWNEVLGYANETEDKTQLQTTQRVTATRMAVGGVFALAAPKKQTHGSVKEKFYDVLHTTTGDIELESTIDSGSIGGSVGEMSRNFTTLAISKREIKVKNIRRYVAEHANRDIAQI